LVQKALAAFGQGDLETAVSCFAGDVAIKHPMPKEMALVWPLFRQKGPREFSVRNVEGPQL
jgi:hypothetical protein